MWGAYGRDCYEFREGSIALTIPFNRINALEPATHSGSTKGADELSKVQAEVLAEIRSDPNATHDQIAASIGKGRTAVVKAIRQLREGGYIERVGSNKSGWWKVL